MNSAAVRRPMPNLPSRLTEGKAASAAEVSLGRTEVSQFYSSAEPDVSAQWSHRRIAFAARSDLQENSVAKVFTVDRYGN